MPRAALILVALLAGCNLDGDATTVHADRVRDLVLQREDVSSVFRRTFILNLGGRPQVAVRYWRPRSLRASGARSIVSAAEVFDTGTGAERRLNAVRAELEEKPDWKPIDEPGLGDESFAATLVADGARSYQVFWRDLNVTASLDVDGFEERLPLAEVLALARKQEGRISDAGG